MCVPPKLKRCWPRLVEMAEGPDTIFSMIDNADLRLPLIQDEEGNEVQLTNGNYLVYIRSKDRRVRKAAFEGMHSTFLKQRNTIAATLSSQVKADIFFTRQHHYASCRERALSRYNIPVAVYDNLVQTVSENIPLMNRYMELRKRVLNLDELHMYDLYVPIVEETTDEISYEQARETVLAGLAALGENYHKHTRQSLQRALDRCLRDAGQTQWRL